VQEICFLQKSVREMMYFACLNRNLGHTRTFYEEKVHHFGNSDLVQKSCLSSQSVVRLKVDSNHALIVNYWTQISSLEHYGVKWLPKFKKNIYFPARN
jgi:hypothetical protein